tara:strand:+ start:198 stop:1121 length:924 start_codon:yes stop_codon:yes gene_type:complete
MSHKTISIIIPCLNAEKTIQRAFDSLKNQTCNDFECIVMDGMSSDKTLEIIEKNSNIVDTLVSEKDDSGADAANKAIKISQGKMICFLYADDYLSEDFVDSIANVFKDNSDIDYISYGMQIQNLYTKKIILKSYKKKNLTASLTNACFKHVLNHAYNKKVFDEIGNLKHLYFDEKIFFSNDREFLIRMVLNGKKNYVIENILYYMQSHKDSYTGSRSNIVRIRYEHIGIADYYLNKKFISSEHIKTLKLFKSHNLALLFAWFIITFNLKSAATVFFMGLKNSKILWPIHIICRPISEIFYRLSIKLF